MDFLNFLIFLSFYIFNLVIVPKMNVGLFQIPVGLFQILCWIFPNTNVELFQISCMIIPNTRSFSSKYKFLNFIQYWILFCHYSLTIEINSL